MRLRGRPRKPRRDQLIASFVKAVEQSGQTFVRVAEAAGMSDNTLSSWGRQTEPNIERFDRAVRAAGYRLVIRRREP